MPKIVIKNLDHKTILIERSSKSVLNNFLEKEVDWMHACGGKGRCTTCSMIIISGKDNLTPETASELRFRDLGRLPDSRRLACQACPKGDLEILVPDPYKLPHLSYSD